MKLSAILVSVNLVAALPVAANAAEEAVSDKADWLKQNLASLQITKGTPLRKASLSDAGLRARPMALRPFVPNRHLPTQRELIEQQARMDESYTGRAVLHSAGSNQVLSGQVAAYEPTIPEPPFNPLINSLPSVPVRRPPVRAAARPAPRTVAGQVPVMPGQILPQGHSGALVPVIPEPPMASAVPANWPGKQASASDPTLKSPSEWLVHPPTLTAEERAMVQQLVELNEPGKSPEFVDLAGGQHQSANAGEGLYDAPAYSSANTNPPPFPLSLLPPEALQGLIGKRTATNAPRATFGSWHQPHKISSLPYGGFQTHIIRGRVNTGSFHEYLPPTSRRRSSSARKSLGRPASQAATTAMYPAYNTPVRGSSF